MIAFKHNSNIKPGCRKSLALSAPTVPESILLPTIINIWKIGSYLTNFIDE